MNTTHCISKFITTLAGISTPVILIGLAQPGFAQDKAARNQERIGIYDSRVVAFGSFWAEAHQRELSERMKAAKEAKAAGQTNRFAELKSALKAEQDKVHLQVFSTAPVDDVLASMKERVQAIQKEAGVSQLVSKWDEKTLAKHKGAEQVDVTDLFLREFKLNERQMKIVADMRKKPPLPLKEAEELARKGEL